jgi:UDP-glucose 4-epimerase
MEGYESNHKGGDTHMKVLVTGGAGYIGSHTCLELLNQGMDVVVIDNLSNSSAESLKRVEALTGKKVSFYEGDVRDRGKLEKIFTDHRIDCMIHFAGLKAVGESVAMPVEYYTNNLDCTLVLCDEARRHGVKKIIFSSSATVYSGDNEMPLRETSKTGNCTNPYGWTKYMGEQILRDISKADTEWSVVLLRYFNPIGAHESGMIGEDPNGIPNNLMPYISQTAIGRRECLSVFGNDYDTPDGTGVRDYIHVVDLAKGHVAAISYLEQHKGCEVFNLGTGKGCSVLDMVKAFEKANGVKIPYKITERRPGDLDTCYSDPEKSNRILGWKAEKTLEDMCRDSWRWQKQNPQGYGK